MPKYEIIHSDCMQAMKAMADNSIDFCVCDPPYMINFMGKDFDKFKDNPAANPEVWKEVLRICKPGSMLAAFGGDRTHHHLMNALEQAGWEIRTCIYWVTGQGFPKSYNFGKQLGPEWHGYGTALKPAVEICVLGMVPLEEGFKENASKWGVAGLNIDESRIDAKPRTTHADGNHKGGGNDLYNSGLKTGYFSEGEKGRWPANIIFDKEAAQELDRQSGNSKSPNFVTRGKRQMKFGMKKQKNVPNHGDYGGASRFFYCAKTSTSERNAGLERMPLKQTIGGGGINNTEDDVCGKYGSIKAKAQNHHPTVKPLALMRYIIKLLAPPGNPILIDPFAGSGSTIVAAKELGISAIGIEKESEYVEIARKRIENTEWIPEQYEMDLTK